MSPKDAGSIVTADTSSEGSMQSCVFKQRHVQFGMVYVHYFKMQMGSNPSVESGLPVELSNISVGTSEYDLAIVDLDEEDNKPLQEVPKLSTQKRLAICLKSHSTQEVQKAMEAIHQIRRERFQSYAEGKLRPEGQTEESSEEEEKSCVPAEESEPKSTKKYAKELRNETKPKAAGVGTTTNTTSAKAKSAKSEAPRYWSPIRFGRPSSNASSTNDRSNSTVQTPKEAAPKATSSYRFGSPIRIRGLTFSSNVPTENQAEQHREVLAAVEPEETAPKASSAYRFGSPIRMRGLTFSSSIPTEKQTEVLAAVEPEPDATLDETRTRENQNNEATPKARRFSSPIRIRGRTFSSNTPTKKQTEQHPEVFAVVEPSAEATPEETRTRETQLKEAAPTRSSSFRFGSPVKIRGITSISNSPAEKQTEQLPEVLTAGESAAESKPEEPWLTGKQAEQQPEAETPSEEIRTRGTARSSPRRTPRTRSFRSSKGIPEITPSTSEERSSSPMRRRSSNDRDKNQEPNRSPLRRRKSKELEEMASSAEPNRPPLRHRRSKELDEMASFAEPNRSSPRRRRSNEMDKEEVTSFAEPNRQPLRRRKSKDMDKEEVTSLAAPNRSGRRSKEVDKEEVSAFVEPNRSPLRRCRSNGVDKEEVESVAKTNRSPFPPCISKELDKEEVESFACFANSDGEQLQFQCYFPPN